MVFWLLCLMKQVTQMAFKLNSTGNILSSDGLPVTSFAGVTINLK